MGNPTRTGSRLSEDELRHNVAAVHAYFKSTGGPPRHPAHHVPFGEGRLRIWWQGKMVSARKDTLSAYVARIFDEEFPDWRATAGPGGTPLPEPELVPFEERIAQLHAYLATHNAFPTADEKLGHWFLEQQRRAAHGDLTSDESAVLDALAPDWRNPGIRKSPAIAKKWAAHIEELREFVSANGRFPSGSSRMGAAENKLHDWLHKVVSKDLDDYARADLTAAAPGWDSADRPSPTPRPERVAEVKPDFVEFVNEVAFFIAANGHVPVSNKHRDAYTNSLARSLLYYRGRLSRGQLSDEHRLLLDEKVPGWRVPTRALKSLLVQGPGEIDAAIEAIERRHPGLAESNPHQFAREVALSLWRTAVRPLPFDVIPAEGADAVQSASDFPETDRPPSIQTDERIPDKEG